MTNQIINIGDDLSDLFANDTVLQDGDLDSLDARLVTVAKDKLNPPDGSPYISSGTFRQDFERDSQTSSLLIKGGYEAREDCIRCGYKTFRCKDRLCRRCCFLDLARPLLNVFQSIIPENREAYYIVLSISSNPDEKSRIFYEDSKNLSTNERGGFADSSNQPYGLEYTGADVMRESRAIWQIMLDVVGESIGSGKGKLFQGALGGPELAVKFAPLRLLPHLNLVAFSSGFSAMRARKLRSIIKTRFTNSRAVRAGIYPSIFVRRIWSREELCNILKYISKPIDIANAYSRALERNDPIRLVQLNLDLQTFLKNLPILFYSLRRMRMMGICSPNHKAYIGLSSQRSSSRKPKYKAHAPRPSAEERWENHLASSEIQSGRIRHSKFSFWEREHFRRLLKRQSFRPDYVVKPSGKVSFIPMRTDL